ncbi:MAG: OmpA family protein [Chlorobi bacterium]|nr:OmpA family protein [Chlorobiota bacterium]
MNKTSAFFSAILLVWMSGSTYWYVCKIKKDCEKKQTKEIISENKIPPKIKEEIKDTLKISADTLSLKDDDNIAKKEEFKEELLQGYTMYNFPKNSTSNKIDDDFKKFADELSDFLSNNPDFYVEITGYTDNTGSEKTNLYFGKKRANFVKNKLVASGIAQEVFIVKTMGEANPIASNETEEGRLKNRRVIIKITKK